MEPWKGLPPGIKEEYAVVRVLKRTLEKELVLLQKKNTGVQVLLRNYPANYSQCTSFLQVKS